MKSSHRTAIFAAFLVALFATSATAALAQSNEEDYRARYGRAEMNISCADAAMVT